MRGAGDEMRIGERVAFYRARRGMSQRILADLVGRSEDWVSKVERGVRDIRRIDVVIDLARALRVELGDLIGQPVLVEGDHDNAGIPAVRDALLTSRRLSRTLFASSAKAVDMPVPRAALLAEHIWADYQHGRVGRVIGQLPTLIGLAQALEDAAGPTERQGWAVSARVHHLAATTLAKVGESDLAWIAAERAMAAADHSDDPLVVASAARAGTHALLVSGRFDDAVELGDTAAEWLRPRVVDDDPAALSQVFRRRTSYRNAGSPT